jgi:thiol-disulfide isomerase/thioredoxin
MKKLLILFLLVSNNLLAQLPYKVIGSLPRYKKTNIQVNGFKGCTPLPLASTTTDSMGNFSFTYPLQYVGAAIVKVQEGPSFLLLLNKENFSVIWDDVANNNSLRYTQSAENEVLKTAINLAQDAEQKIAGLQYLLPLYSQDAQKAKWLQNEVALQQAQFFTYVNSLPANSYAKQYVQWQKKVVDMLKTGKQNTERLSQHLEDFKKINFLSDELWHSGLVPQLLEGMYAMLESLNSKDKITLQGNNISSVWISNLASNVEKQQEVGEFCFKLLERQNRNSEAEFIALTLLNQTHCTLDAKRTNLFEQYRKLAIGNTAPDIALNKTTLKQLNAKYKLVVFGASWCPNCKTDYPSLVGSYKQLKEQYKTEVVYVSLDTSKQAFQSYYNQAPFIMVFDGKGWQGQATKDYSVFATPTYILVNNNLKILAKLTTPQQLMQWLQNEALYKKQ